MKNKIPVFAVNLIGRKDRFVHICNEFHNKDEFELKVLQAKPHNNGAIGLWENIVQIIKEASERKLGYIILCEDDHQFSKKYSPSFLHESINAAEQRGADVLLCGVSWFKSALQVSDHLFWVNKFSGLQFTVIFSKFFAKILEADFMAGDAADYKISALTKSKFLMAPFISTQKEFGYSDVTYKNNEKGYINKIFRSTKLGVSQLAKVKKHYQLIPVQTDVDETAYDEFVLPAYIICTSGSDNGRQMISQQFENKAEFNKVFVDYCENTKPAVGLWNTIVNVIHLAIKNDDDVILICQEDHEFTTEYNRELMFNHIVAGHQQGVELISGGAAVLGQVVPIGSGRFWTNPLSSIQFIIVYRSLFERIINFTFRSHHVVENVLSLLTSNKILLHPFISVGKATGQIIGIENDKSKESDLFVVARDELALLNNAYLEYCQ